MVETWEYHVTNADACRFIPQPYFQQENAIHMTVNTKFVFLYGFNGTK